MLPWHCCFSKRKDSSMRLNELQVLLDDLRIALNWVAHNLYTKVRSSSILKIPNSQIILTHGFKVDLDLP